MPRCIVKFNTEPEFEDGVNHAFIDIQKVLRGVSLEKSPFKPHLTMAILKSDRADDFNSNSPVISEIIKYIKSFQKHSVVMHPCEIKITDNGWLMCTFLPIPELGCDNSTIGAESANISQLPKIISKIIDNHNINGKIQKDKYMDKGFLPHISLGKVDISFLDECRKIVKEHELEILDILNKKLPYLVISSISIEGNPNKAKLKWTDSYSLPKRDFGICSIGAALKYGWITIIFSSRENRSRFFDLYQVLSHHIRVMDDNRVDVNEDEFNHVAKNFCLQIPDKKPLYDSHFGVSDRYDRSSRDRNVSGHGHGTPRTKTEADYCAELTKKYQDISGFKNFFSHGVNLFFGFGSKNKKISKNRQEIINSLASAYANEPHNVLDVAQGAIKRLKSEKREIGHYFGKSGMLTICEDIVNEMEGKTRKTNFRKN